MSTVISYNGITLSGVTTREFQQQVVMDDSDTDVLYSKFTVTVECLLHARTAGPQWGGRAENNAEFTTGARLEADIRHDLSEPRKEFQMTVGNDVLLEADAETDANNGPKTRNVNVRYIRGIRSLLVEFTIEICKNECGVATRATAKKQQPVISNRWSAQELIDENFFCERAVEGRLRVSHIRINPQAYRHVVVPEIPLGFKIKLMQFTTDRSGLNLDYHIVYKQEYAAPPSPATKWSGTHTETAEKGILTTANITCRLEGPPGVDKGLLLTRLFQIVTARVGRFPKSTASTLRASITDHFDKPIVEVNITVLRSNVGTDAFNTATGTFGTYNLPNYAPAVFPRLLSFGPKNPAEIFMMRWGNPCQGDLPYVKGTSGKKSSDPSSPLIVGTVNLVPQLLNLPTVIIPSYWSTQQNECMYTKYVKRIQINENYNTELLGNADPDGSTSITPIIPIKTAPTVTSGSITVLATRVGCPPDLDYSQLDEPNTIPIGSYTVEQQPRRLPDGQLEFSTLMVRIVFFGDKGGVDRKQAERRLQAQDPTDTRTEGGDDDTAKIKERDANEQAAWERANRTAKSIYDLPD